MARKDAKKVRELASDLIEMDPRLKPFYRKLFTKWSNRLPELEQRYQKFTFKNYTKDNPGIIAVYICSGGIFALIMWIVCTLDEKEFHQQLEIYKTCVATATQKV